MVRNFLFPEEMDRREAGVAEATPFNRDKWLLPENVLAKSSLLALARSIAAAGGVMVETPCGAAAGRTRFAVAWTTPREENWAW